MVSHHNQEVLLANSEQELKKQFYDIVNGEDWDDMGFPERPQIDEGDVPLGDILIPTPIPGVWIHLNLSFEIEDEKW